MNRAGTDSLGTVRRVGIVCKRDADGPERRGRDLARWLEERGIETRMNALGPELDMAVVLGGDGTLLHVAPEAGRTGVPLLGINLGNLGFLTEVAEEEMYPALEAALAGKVTVERRMMLRARLLDREGRQRGEERFALNEVVPAKPATARVARIRAWAGEELITTYRADGLIVSTPTGSTAYNLSAGGPIVEPQLRAILVTPICPFMLESRPVLLGAGATVCITLADEDRGELRVIVDGVHAWDLHPGERLLIGQAPRPLLLIASPHKGYFAILRNKLNWGGGW